MNLSEISAVREELENALRGRKFGKVFQLSRFAIVVDFRLPDSSYLFISIEPAAPRIYLIRRRLRDLERSAGNLSPFMLFVRKRLSGADLDRVEQFEGERVVVFAFNGEDELGERLGRFLVVQLTGRSSNLFVLDANRRILESARDTLGEGQQVGDIYRPPGGANERVIDAAETFRSSAGSPSETLDNHYLQLEAQGRFHSLAAAARTKIKQEIAKREKLISRLNDDLRQHGEAQKWKRFGDLLLANVATAKRSGNTVTVTDYFDEQTPYVDIEVDENDSLTEAAEHFFKRYTKARNAAGEIAERLKKLDSELRSLNEKKQRLEAAIADANEDVLNELAGAPAGGEGGKREARQPALNPGVRQFASSDGFDILIGKKAKDNDFLTFRMAKSLDLWLHAADYPGSHVVVKNPNRKEIPHRTLLEAAQLAAFYSQGKQQTKAAVHYTQKKFVNKPKGAAPGLVSLASFKTILVEPKNPHLE